MHETTFPVPEDPLRSTYTANFPAILEELGVSLAITTYQQGKLVLVRSADGILNTHFRVFNYPMGIAVAVPWLAVGTTREIIEFRNVPAVSASLTSPRQHDACYLPRSSHVTGEISVHEMCYCDNELWFVNTRFSCLATLDRAHNFVPRWRPKFITHLFPGDCCHLNGMACHEGRPCYVTALGSSAVAESWRESKANGGVLIDVQTGETIVSGLSMPHSPRMAHGRLWLLDSGRGSLGYVDIQQRVYHPVVELPGFTRGLDFCQHYAFVGLSQVRESAIFSGIEVTQRLSAGQRKCGIGVIDLRSGQLVAFLNFEQAVQEIFAVSVLPHRFPELINDNLEMIGNTYVLPDTWVSDVPEQYR